MPAMTTISTTPPSFPPQQHKQAITSPAYQQSLSSAAPLRLNVTIGGGGPAPAIPPRARTRPPPSPSKTLPRNTSNDRQRSRTTPVSQGLAELSSSESSLDGDSRRRRSSSVSMTASSSNASIAGPITPDCSTTTIHADILESGMSGLALDPISPAEAGKEWLPERPVINPRSTSIMLSPRSPHSPASSTLEIPPVVNVSPRLSNHTNGIGMWVVPSMPSRKVSDGSMETVSSMASGFQGSLESAAGPSQAAGGYKTNRMLREEELEGRKKHLIESKDGRTLLVGGVPKKASSSGVYTPPTFPGARGPRPACYPSNVYTPANFSGPTTPKTPTSPARDETAQGSSYFPESPIQKQLPSSAEQYAQIRKQKSVGARLSGLANVTWNNSGSTGKRTSYDHGGTKTAMHPPVPELPKTAPMPFSQRFRTTTSPVMPLSGRFDPTSPVASAFPGVSDRQRSTSASAALPLPLAPSGFGLGLGMEQRTSTIEAAQVPPPAMNATRNHKNLKVEPTPLEVDREALTPWTTTSSGSQAGSPVSAASGKAGVRRKPVPKVRESMLVEPAPVKRAEVDDGRQRVLDCAPPLEDDY